MPGKETVSWKKILICKKLTLVSLSIRTYLILSAFVQVQVPFWCLVSLAEPLKIPEKYCIEEYKRRKEWVSYWFSIQDHTIFQKKINEILLFLFSIGLVLKTGQVVPSLPSWLSQFSFSKVTKCHFKSQLAPSSCHCGKKFNIERLINR